MKKFFVEFLSPGSFVSESSEREVPSFEVVEACEIASEIKERYGAKPYGFRFIGRICHGPIDVDGHMLEVMPKTIHTSGIYYLGGTLLRFCDVPVNKSTEIMRDNMRCNDMPICVENRNSYRFTGEFGVDDCIVENGEVVRRGNDSDLMEYRKQFSAERKEYYRSIGVES